jgi:hypothetical protein
MGTLLYIQSCNYRFWNAGPGGYRDVYLGTGLLNYIDVCILSSKFAEKLAKNA